MWQITVNGVRMPTIYWSFSEALAAARAEQERGCAVLTNVVRVETDE